MKPIIRISTINGLIAGVVGALLVIGLYYLGKHPFLFPVYMDFRIFLFGIFIFFTLKELREVYYDGFLYFWQGMAAAFIFTAVYAMVASGSIVIFAMAVPEFLKSYIHLNIDQLRNLPADVVQRIGKDVVDRNLKLLPSTDVTELAALYFWQSLLIGFFISIILSVILRRQPKT
jgi:hypothetical protein